MDPHCAYWSSHFSAKIGCNSRATRHMTKHQRLFSNYQQSYSGKEVIGDDSSLCVPGCGDVLIGNTKFGEALHVLGMDQFFSIYCITHTNKKVEFWLD